MKDFLINCINWIFESHALTLPGWLWIALPIVITLFFIYIAANFLGSVLEEILGVFWNR